MPIPNVSTLYQKLGKGAEGGLEFARFIKLLLISEYKNSETQFFSESDASGDFKGLDAYSIEANKPEGLLDGFQFKFYPAKLNLNQKNEIIKSIEKAIDKNTLLEQFILVTPEDFMKEEQEWFERIKDKYSRQNTIHIEGLFTCQYESTFIHWGHSQILELVLKHDHIGIRYFPELFPVGVGKFKLAKTRIDTNISSWHTSEKDNNSYRLGSPESDKLQTSDPVFDFHFVNNSDKVFLLNSIEIHILRVTTLLNGFSADKLLKSIGCLEHRIDFNKPINTIELDDPLIFEPKKPMRFNIQLTDFTNDCPGNSVKMKFIFCFDDTCLLSNEFYLGF